MPTAEGLMTDEEFDNLMQRYEAKLGPIPRTNYGWILTTMVYMEQIAEQMEAAILSGVPIADWDLLEDELYRNA
jgi:hypothetical protein